MRILLIGSGGREHALAWKLRQSPLVTDILVAPGNGGTLLEGLRHAAVGANDIAGLVELAQNERSDLVVPGPELPLTLGITDAMTTAGIACFGPSKYCAQLEGSKAFAKDIMHKANIPTASHAVFDDYDAACAYVQKKGVPLVIKADGLASGKGVVIASTVDHALNTLDAFMQRNAHGAAGTTVLIEEYLQGEEVSLLCFCDGVHALPMSSAQDHKAVYDNDTGPNTGGMGAYSPAPVLPDDHTEMLTDMVIRPVVRHLAHTGNPFVGILYAGIIITPQGPKVLEYNTRFGDPECQPLLLRMETDLASVMQACVQGRLSEMRIHYTPQTALGVVLSAQGYPDASLRGMEIRGIPEADALPGVKVFHSGTQIDHERVLANGGRVLCVTALGNTLEHAQNNAYAALRCIHMDKGHFRTDIGKKGLSRTAHTPTS